VPDPKNPRQLLLDQSMCTRVKHVLDDLVAVGGYVPSRPVSFDPEDGSAVAGGGAADAAGAGNLAPRPPPPRNPAPPEKPRGGGGASSSASSGPEPLDAPQMLAALRSGGRVFEVWHSGGAARRARVLIDGAGGGTVVAHFDEGDSESFPLSGLRVVNEGVYAGFKRRMMGRNPKPALCVSLEQAAHHGGAHRARHLHALDALFCRLCAFLLAFGWELPVPPDFLLDHVHQLVHPARGALTVHVLLGHESAFDGLLHQHVQRHALDAQIVFSGNFLGDHQVVAGLGFAGVGDGGRAHFKIAFGRGQLLIDSDFLRLDKGQAVLAGQHVKVGLAQAHHQVLFGDGQNSIGLLALALALHIGGHVRRSV
jgi:hypothetical protein